MRRLAFALLAVAAVAPLGGCAVSLFSKDDGDGADLERLESLERRMDAVERALPK